MSRTFRYGQSSTQHLLLVLCSQLKGLSFFVNVSVVIEFWQGLLRGFCERGDESSGLIYTYFLPSGNTVSGKLKYTFPKQKLNFKYSVKTI
jgi:hypothetical protein